MLEKRGASSFEAKGREAQEYLKRKKEIIDRMKEIGIEGIDDGNKDHEEFLKLTQELGLLERKLVEIEEADEEEGDAMVGSKNIKEV